MSFGPSWSQSTQGLPSTKPERNVTFALCVCYRRLYTAMCVKMAGGLECCGVGAVYVRVSVQAPGVSYM